MVNNANLTDQTRGLVQNNSKIDAFQALHIPAHDAGTFLTLFQRRAENPDIFDRETNPGEVEVSEELQKAASIFRGVNSISQKLAEKIDGEMSGIENYSSPDADGEFNRFGLVGALSDFASSLSEESPAEEMQENLEIGQEPDRTQDLLFTTETDDTELTSVDSESLDVDFVANDLMSYRLLESAVEQSEDAESLEEAAELLDSDLDDEISDLDDAEQRADARAAYEVLRGTLEYARVVSVAEEAAVKGESVDPTEAVENATIEDYEELFDDLEILHGKTEECEDDKDFRGTDVEYDFEGVDECYSGRELEFGRSLMPSLVTDWKNFKSFARGYDGEELAYHVDFSVVDSLDEVEDMEYFEGIHAAESDSLSEDSEVEDLASEVASSEEYLVVTARDDGPGLSPEETDDYFEVGDPSGGFGGYQSGKSSKSIGGETLMIEHDKGGKGIMWVVPI